ncbi:MAG: hypothetical protein ACO3FN_11715, partial [Vulcanococcus sp.]
MEQISPVSLSGSPEVTGKAIGQADGEVAELGQGESLPGVDRLKALADRNANALQWSVSRAVDRGWSEAKPTGGSSDDSNPIFNAQLSNLIDGLPVTDRAPGAIGTNQNESACT